MKMVCNIDQCLSHPSTQDRECSFGLSKSEMMRQAMRNSISNQNHCQACSAQPKSTDTSKSHSSKKVYKYYDRQTQHNNPYVQLYDKCGRVIHVGRQTIKNNDINNNKSTSTETRHIFLKNNKNQAINNQSTKPKISNNEKFETFITLSNQPMQHGGVKRMLYVTSTPTLAYPLNPTKKNKNVTMAKPSIKLYVQNKVGEFNNKTKITDLKRTSLSSTSEIDNDNDDDDEDKKSSSMVNQQLLTLETTSLDEISIKQTTYPNISTNICLQNSEPSKILVSHVTQRSGSNNTKKKDLSHKSTGIANHKQNQLEKISNDTKKLHEDSRDSSKKIQMSVSSPDSFSIISIANTPMSNKSKQVIKVIEAVPQTPRSTVVSKAIPTPPPLPSSLNRVHPMNCSYDSLSNGQESETSFPWEKLDGEKIKGTVWEKCKANLSEVNFTDLIEEYNKNHNPTTHCNTHDRFCHKDKITCQTYLKYKKAYNLAIILGGLKKPVASIVDGLRQLNDNVITPEVVTHLLQYGPDDEEAMQLLAVEDPDILEKPDFLAYELLRLPLYTERLKAMLLRSSLDEKIEDIYKSINIVMKACSTLEESKNVRELIALVLVLGNWLNKDSSRYGKASGFKVDVLNKLENMRIKNRQLSVMNLLLRLTRKQFNKDNNFQQEIQIINDASTIDINSIDDEVKKISQSIKEAEETICKIREDEPSLSTEIFIVKMNAFLCESSEKIMRLKKENNQLREMFNNLRKYFGDDGKDTTSEKFFTTFKCFLSKFQS